MIDMTEAADIPRLLPSKQSPEALAPSTPPFSTPKHFCRSITPPESNTTPPLTPHSLHTPTAYEDAPPSLPGAPHPQDYYSDLPEPCVLVSRARILKSQNSRTTTTAPDPSAVLHLWAEAVTITVLQGPSALPPSVWQDLMDAMHTASHSLSIPEIIEFLRLLTTALHRVGPPLNPSAFVLATLADRARTAFKSREHSSDELLDYQSAVADILRVVSLAGGGGSCGSSARKSKSKGSASSRRAQWGEGVAVKLVPLAAVGMAGVYATYKSIARETDKAGAYASSTTTAVHHALFFAEALLPVALLMPPYSLCSSPSSTTSTDGKEEYSSLLLCDEYYYCGKENAYAYVQSGSLFKRLFTSCFSPPPPSPSPPLSSYSGSNRKAVHASTPPPSLSFYSSSLAKIHYRARAIAEWMQDELVPVALPAMTLRQLDRFTAALVAAAGDDDTSCSGSGSTGASTSTSREVLVGCAGEAVREAAHRVHQAELRQTPLSINSTRRIAATARRNWEVAASDKSPKADAVAGCTAVLERYIAKKEDEEHAAVREEIAAATAALRRQCRDHDHQLDELYFVEGSKTPSFTFPQTASS